MLQVNCEKQNIYQNQRRKLRRFRTSKRTKPIEYEIENIKFDYNPKEIIKSYIDKIKLYGFEKNHPFLKFTYIGNLASGASDVKGLYDTTPYPIIYLNNCKIENPLKTLYHELGHHLYFGFDNAIQNKIIKYINKNIKVIKKPKKFLKNCKKLNLRTLRVSNPKLYNIICLVLSKIYDEENSFYYTIPDLNYRTLSLIDNPIYINTKLESLYSPDEEEIFCEMFAAYMSDTCLYKENKKFIEDLF